MKLSPVPLFLFFVFVAETSFHNYVHQGCHKNCNIVKYYYNVKLINADLLLKKHFLLLSMLKTIVLLNFFVEKVIYFSRFFDEHKEQHLF